jgi:NTE family protein
VVRSGAETTLRPVTNHSLLPTPILIMKVVAVFGGGGAKAVAHAGAWKALLEASLVPSHIVGTSMGAVIAAAFAAGSTYDQVVGTALAFQRKDFAAVDAWSVAKGVFAGNLFKAEPLKRTIARLVPAPRFADLKTPLTITATDLDSGELVLFGAPIERAVSDEVRAQLVHLGDDVPLVDALYASCALPLYFSPGLIGGRRLGDGGLRAVLGLPVAQRVTADLVVAVDVGPGFDEPPVDKKAPVPPLIRAHGEAIRVMMAAQTERAIADWPKDAARLVVVRAVAEREATFAVGNGERYVEAGYRETKRALGGTFGRG